MIRSSCAAVFVLFMVLIVRASAANTCDCDPHIRTTSLELLDALESGSRQSPTFRHLVHRLESSGVVVYLTFDADPQPVAAGHLSFIGAAGGRRYVQIAIDRRSMGRSRIAILGHELRHAVEIAEAPSVTDPASMASLYERIGFRGAHGHRITFETQDAIDAGRQVQRELLRSTGTSQARRNAEFTQT